MLQILTGMTAMGYLVAGLFFLRFWRQTRDRLFIMFAISFALLAGQRLALGLTTQTIENVTYLYVIRLIAFVIILYGIIDKNLAARKKT
jgi:hypothetical protein